MTAKDDGGTVNEGKDTSDPQSFTITIKHRLAVSEIGLSNGKFSLSWSTEAGRTYGVQYKDNLTKPEWIDLNPGISGDGSQSTYSESIGQISERFYRIVQFD